MRGSSLDMSKRQRVPGGYTCRTKRKVRSITDFFQNAEAHQSDPSSSSCLLDRDQPGVPLLDADDDELKAQDDEMSLEVEQPVTTSNVRPGPGSVSRTAHPQGLLDVGDLVKPAMTAEELESAVDSLTDSEKYEYLTGYF